MNITHHPVIWQGDGWQQQDKKVSVSFASAQYNVRVFNTTDDVKNQFFPNHNEVEIGPGSNPILDPDRGFFIEPWPPDRSPINSRGYRDMRENNNHRILNKCVGDPCALEWIKHHKLQAAWMKNMPDLSIETFSSLEKFTHVVDLTVSLDSFPWEAIDHYEAHNPLSLVTCSYLGRRKDLFTAHGFYPIQRIFIPENSERGSKQVSGTIYVKVEEID